MTGKYGLKYACVAGLTVLMVTACTPMAAPRDALARVNQEFDGRDANAFFVSYGSAAGSKPAQDGGRNYRWISLEPHGGGGDSDILSGTGHYAMPGEDNGEMVTGYCEIRIHADAQDRITTIKLVSDSIGKFSDSRCAEIFGQGAN